jgi:FixJ family two-component response regulator
MTASSVIVVDDDASVRTKVARLLRSIGYDVETFPTAEEFLKHQGNECSPRCLVLDVQMPGSSGLNLQEQLTRRNSSAAIVFHTAHCDIRTSVRGMER